MDTFWELLDEMLNAVLFVLIGLEVIALELAWNYVLIGVVLFTRLISVGGPILAMRFVYRFSPGAIKILTWGGLRGGISIALALSLPATPERDLILTVTYMVVVFSVLVQGLTLGPLIKKVGDS